MISDKQEGEFSLKIHSLDGFTTPESKKRPKERDNPLPDEAVAVLQRAIQRGVPAYNNGSPEVCAAIYQTALEDVLLLKSEDLSQSQIKFIQDGLLNAASLSSDQKAWALRYIMDDLLAG